MADTTIVLPSKPKIIKEEGNRGSYEIDGLYPGYGHTLGNSLRRVILSSIEGAAITSIKIKGVAHEFSAMEGVKDDVIMMILNLKKLRIKLHSTEPQTIKLSVKGPKVVTASDLKLPSQAEIMNPDAAPASSRGTTAKKNYPTGTSQGRRRRSPGRSTELALLARTME